MGNLQSVQNALDYIGAPCRVIQTPSDFHGCNKLILPGVGAFRRAMHNLDEFELRPMLDEFVLEKKVPLLGICLGLQLIFESSMEGGLCTGLGYVRGAVLPLEEQLKDRPVPHMGWNSVEIVKPTGWLFAGIQDMADFYFVHSFYCRANDRSDVAGQTEYGFLFDVAIERENVFGTQFHPEKSHKAGIRVLENFWKMPC
jgi:glutamine amidotransferase